MTPAPSSLRAYPGNPIASPLVVAPPTWMPGTSPGMTTHYVTDVEGLPFAAARFFSTRLTAKMDSS